MTTPARLLVVEDEPLVRDVLAAYLRQDPYEVEFAEDGLEGLEKFKAGSFDLVLTDRAMPGLNGDQLALEIKALAPAARIILLTGYGDMLSGPGNRPEGVDYVVGKPFTMDVLRDAIIRALADA